MKQTISAKVNDDLFKIMNEIYNYRKISHNNLIVSSIKHYIISSSVEGIPNLEQPDTKTKIYALQPKNNLKSTSDTHGLRRVMTRVALYASA